MNQAPNLCEIWDLTFCTPPSHSRLYALEPLGAGTPNIESLTSYMSRLAEAHSVSLRTLMIQELLPLLKRDYLSNPSNHYLGAFWKEAVRALNGTGILARDWVRVLEHLTLHSDLHFLTLLPWAAVLTQQRLLRITRAWCPDCFMDWQAAGQPIYEPLLWNMSAVSLCIQHQRTLVEQCPYPDCGATLPVLASHFRPGYCSKCSRWLGVAVEHPNPSLETEQWHWQVWVAEMIGELLRHNIDLTTTPHLENISDLITAAQEQIADGDIHNLEKRLQISRRTVNAWRSGKQVPQIESLLRLCYCCGVSACDLFTSQRGAFNLTQIKARSLLNIPNPNNKRRHRIPFDTVLIQQGLESVLVSEEQPPPSMRIVAKRLNYSPRELREHFPRLCRAISSRYKNYRKTRSKQKMRQLKDDVRQVMLKIHSQGLYPATSRVCLLLNRPSIMRDPIIYSFWQETLRELRLAK